MKIAFYAPLKSPHSARPSGDRRIAQLFMRALQNSGWRVELASALRAWEGHGEAQRQYEIKTRGRQIAAQLIAQYQRQPRAAQPCCWFTYHVYHKAPDYLGPAVSAALDIPYVLAECSVANKQRGGAWRDGYADAVVAVRHADLIFNLNSADLRGVQAVAKPTTPIVQLKPFTELRPAAGAHNKARLRAEFAATHSLDAKKHWLLCVAMMRAGDKLKSYQMLAAAMAQMQRDDWQLLVVGDGAAAAQVRALFGACPRASIHFFGRREAAFVQRMMRAADVFVWPAHNEAFGMAALEAVGCGLPVVAGNSGGIGDIVQHAVTGRLLAQPEANSMAEEIEKLLAAPATLQRMSAKCLATFDQFHQLDAAAVVIDQALRKVVRRGRSWREK